MRKTPAPIWLLVAIVLFGCPWAARAQQDPINQKVPGTTRHAFVSRDGRSVFILSDKGLYRTPVGGPATAVTMILEPPERTRLVVGRRGKIGALVEPGTRLLGRARLLKINTHGVVEGPYLMGASGPAEIAEVRVGSEGPVILTGTPLQSPLNVVVPWRWQFWKSDGTSVGAPRTTPNMVQIQLDPEGRVAVFEHPEKIEVVTALGTTRTTIPGSYRFVSLSDSARTIVLNDRKKRNVVKIWKGPRTFRFDAGQAVHGTAVSRDGTWVFLWLRDRTLVLLRIKRDGVKPSWIEPPFDRSSLVRSAVVENDGNISLATQSFTGPEPSVEVFRLKRTKLVGRGVYKAPDIERRVPRLEDARPSHVVVRDRSQLRRVTLTAVRPQDLRLHEPPPPIADFKPMWAMLDPSTLPDTGWPLGPTSEEHTVANTLEFKDYQLEDTTDNTIHSGADILGANDGTDVYRDVVITVSGEITHSTLEQGDAVYRQLQVKGDDGSVYIYGHVDPYPDALATEIRNNEERVEAGTVIGMVAQWDACASIDFSHLHYGVNHFLDGETSAVNALGKMVPYDDTIPPEIGTIGMCPDDGEQPPGCNNVETWDGCEVLEAPDGEACVEVIGETPRDIIVQVRDRSHGDTVDSYEPILGVREVRWRVCPGEVCGDWSPSIAFDAIPSSWTDSPAQAACPLFSHRPNADTFTDYCESDDFHYIVTNVLDGGADIDTPSREGRWDPSSSPVGYRVLEIVAEDFGNNSVSRTIPLCVDPDGTCGVDLVIRDCEDDGGFVPSNCEASEVSPDIDFSAPVNADGEFDTASTEPSWIDVCITNLGCDPIPEDRSIKITLLARQSFGSRPVSRSESVRAAMLTRDGSVSPTGGDWPPGERRCTRRTSLDGEDEFLKLAVVGLIEVELDTDGDPPESASVVRFDNNRAIRSLD